MCLVYSRTKNKKHLQITKPSKTSKWKNRPLFRLPVPDIKPGPDYIQDSVQRQHRPHSVLSVFQPFIFKPHEIPATEATVFWKGPNTKNERVGRIFVVAGISWLPLGEGSRSPLNSLNKFWIRWLYNLYFFFYPRGSVAKTRHSGLLPTIFSVSL